MTAFRVFLLAVTLLVSLGAGVLYHSQVRSGFEPPEATLDLLRPESFLEPGSGTVEPSPIALLRWRGDAPLRARLPFVGGPSTLRLKLFAEHPGTLVDVAIDGERVARLELEPRWNLHQVGPRAGETEFGDTLELSLAPGSAPGPVHLSAVRTSSVEQRSSGYPRYWVVPEGVDRPPPASTLRLLVPALALLLAAAGPAPVRRAGGLAAWLRLVGPGVALLAALGLAARAAGLRLLYPPSSFPALLLSPGLLWLAWRHRRRLLAGARRAWSGSATALRPVTAAVARHPAPVLALAALALWGWLLADLTQKRYDGDPRGFVLFGTRHDTASLFTGVEPVGELGYDGQFYAVLSTDPLLLRHSTVRHLDTPSYRAVRIMVPALAWTFGLGRPDAALAAYIALCWLLCLAVVPLAALRLQADSGSGWWAAPLLLNAGLAAAMFRTTLDGAALCFLLLALEAFRRRRGGWAALAATAAALTREAFVVGGLAMAAVELRRRRWRAALLHGLLPTGALALWRLRVAAAVPGPEQAPPGELFTVPLSWLPEKLAQLAELAVENPYVRNLEIVCLAAVALSVLAAIPLARNAARNPGVLVLGCFVALALLFSFEIYEEAAGYTRVLAPIPVLGLLATGDGDLRRPVAWALRACAGLWAVAGWGLLSMLR